MPLPPPEASPILDYLKRVAPIADDALLVAARKHKAQQPQATEPTAVSEEGGDQALRDLGISSKQAAYLPPAASHYLAGAGAKYAAKVDVDPILDAFKEFQRRGWSDAEHIVGGAVKDKALSWWEKIPPSVRAGMLVGVPTGVGSGAALSQVRDPKTHKKWGMKGLAGGLVLGTSAGLGAGFLRKGVRQIKEYDRLRDAVERGSYNPLRTPLERLKGQDSGMGELLDAIKARVPDAPWDPAELKQQDMSGTGKQVDAVDDLLMPLRSEYIHGLQGKDLSHHALNPRSRGLLSLLHERMPEAGLKDIVRAMTPEHVRAATQDYGIPPEVMKKTKSTLGWASPSSLFSRSPEERAAFEAGLERRHHRLGYLQDYKREINKAFTTSKRVKNLHDKMLG